MCSSLLLLFACLRSEVLLAGCHRFTPIFLVHKLWQVDGCCMIISSAISSARRCAAHGVPVENQCHRSCRYLGPSPIQHALCARSGELVDTGDVSCCKQGSLRAHPLASCRHLSSTLRWIERFLKALDATALPPIWTGAEQKTSGATPMPMPTAQSLHLEME